MRTAKQWLQWLFQQSDKYRRTNGEALVWQLGDMQYPEISSLIDSCISFGNNEDADGFNMAKWISDNTQFNLYNQWYTVLRVNRKWHYEEGVIMGLRVRIDDIDDGGNSYYKKIHDEIEAKSLLDYFKAVFAAEPILDTVKLKRILEEKEFRRVG